MAESVRPTGNRFTSATSSTNATHLALELGAVMSNMAALRLQVRFGDIIISRTVAYASFYCVYFKVTNPTPKPSTASSGLKAANAGALNAHAPMPPPGSLAAWYEG